MHIYRAPLAAASMAVILLYARQLIHVELTTHTVSRTFLED